MKIGIMQPYFLPYIGYWQLMNKVDRFVVYDNIQYTKRGWIRRNRILMNNTDKMITLPIKKDSDFLDIKERFLSERYENEKSKIKNQVKEAYKKAPYYKKIEPLLIKILDFEDKNLFNYLLNSLRIIKEYLGIKTEIIISSEIEMNHNLKAEERVIETCKKMEADHYINPIGGTELYNKEDFKKEEIKLNFIKTNDIKYKQFNNEFIPNLSIIDVMMFNSKEEIKDMLEKYTLE
ncbi:WbqC-like protein [Oceanotoga teriensis]|uniref:WbqC-like protein n=1 Tax=Oceanotoga teriensis TaxID=515440 RepID=A0AA45HJA5_9BACT|nr:WbqC family protein [Oceanotoga teriensis]PWJ95854.1 WbqC-like protein [Oceanotoga teriensis]